MVKRLSLLLVAFVLMTANAGRFAVYWRQLTTSTDTSNTTTYLTSSFQMDTNHTYLVAVATSDSATLVHTHSLTSSHTGGTWAQIKTVTLNTSAAPTERLSLWKGKCSANGSGVITNTTSDAATGCAMVVWELTGTDVYASLIVQSNSVNGTTADPSLALPGAPDSTADNLVVMALADGSNGSSAAINSAWNALEDADIGYNTPATGLAVYGSMRAQNATAKVTRTASEWGAIVVEVRRVQPSAPVAGGSFTASATTFDGTNDQMARGADLTGNADAKVGTLSLWVKRGATAATHDILCNTGQRFEVFIDASDKIRINGYNAAGTQIMDMRSVGTYTSTTTWYHILADWDLAAGTKNLYVNDTSDLTSPLFTNDTLDYTRTDFFVGANDSSGARLNACLSEVYLNVATRLDFSNSTNRRKFDDGGSPLKPISLGSDGSTPTGSAPIIYLGNAFGTFQNNLGGGGNFTVTGALTACSDHP